MSKDTLEFKHIFEFVREKAIEEIKKELFDKEVQKEKERLLKKKKYWFPYRIKIINLNKES